jgi:phospholipase C
MSIVRDIGLGAALAAAAAGLAACAGSPGMPSALQPLNVASAQHLLSQAGGIDKIQHIVIAIQENRSFDNLFQGYPGADTQSYGYDSAGKKLQLIPVSLKAYWDVEHDAEGFLAACNGTGSYPGTDCQMNGFNNEEVSCGKGLYAPCPSKNPMYAYVPQSETKPYFDMASQYVLADRMFASNFDASSFIAHQYLIAAYASQAVNYPSILAWGCYGGKTDTIHLLSQQRQIEWNDTIPVCFDNQTLGDELDSAHLSWRFYTSGLPNGDGHLWSAYSAIKHIYYGADWKKDIKNPQTIIFKDIKKGALPTVSWITPTCQHSDHASCKSDSGPAWIASIVNAIGQSQYWNSTAIFVVWDDYGGWYDHVAPKKLDYDGLGMRVPLLVISPYAKKGYVSHEHYELASLLKFIEQRFDLASLAASDARATSPAADCFDFSQSPRAFKVIPAKEDEEEIIHEPPDLRPVDTE